MTSRSMLERPGRQVQHRGASRAPARPARASAIAVSIRASGGVRRARREVRPSTCSANVTAGQSGLPQKNRRTASRISTRLAADRRVGQPPPVGAVHPARGLAAPRAYTVISAGTRPDAQQAARHLGGLHDHPGQVRQQPLQADPVLA